MKSVLISLFLFLTVGCTTTEYITKYQELKVIPPAVYLVSCQQPFYEPPQTYGEAVERDPVWLAAWQTCAEQIEALRHFYELDE